MGGHKVYLRTDEYQDGRIGEIFILPVNIDDIESSSSHIYEYANVTLPGDLA